jgi:hypothetical protein
MHFKICVYLQEHCNVQKATHRNWDSSPISYLLAEDKMTILPFYHFTYDAAKAKLIG